MSGRMASSPACATMFNPMTLSPPLAAFLRQHSPVGGSAIRAALPAGPAEEMGIVPARLGVFQWGALQGQDGTAGCLQHRLGGAGVPFHGSPEPGVEVGL